MSPGDRAVLAALVPDDLLDALHVAHAQDQRRAAAARDPRDVHGERYRREQANARGAWERVGEIVADWLCSSSDPVVPIDEDRVRELARVSIVPQPSRTSLRVVRTGAGS